jgi:hypothetical protein
VAFIRKRLSEVMEGTADASIFEAKLKKFWWTQRQKRHAKMNYRNLIDFDR